MTEYQRTFLFSLSLYKKGVAIRGIVKLVYARLFQSEKSWCSSIAMKHNVTNAIPAK